MDEKIKKLMLALTAHADDLQLYANGIAEDAEAELSATEDAIYSLIGALYERYGELGLRMDYRTVKYLETLKRKIQEIRAAAFDDDEDDLDEASGEVVAEESEFLADFFAFLTGVAISAPKEAELTRIARYGIYNGNTRKQIFDRLASGDADRIYDAIADSFQKGKSADEAAQAVRRELRKTGRYVKSEVDAVINGVANDAALAFAAANRTKLVYSAVLDDHVCEECAGFDGNVFNYNDPDIPSLPRHIHCRCRLVPSMDGEKTAVPTSFAEYLSSLPASGQRKRLGTAKYAAWKSGDYKLKTYETPNPGQRLSMAEVKARHMEMMRQTNVDFNPHGFMKISAPIIGKSVESLRRYTCGEDGMYDRINRYMRAAGNAPKDKLLDGMIADINYILSMSTLDRDLTVFRGMKSEHLFNALTTGAKEIPIDAFQSTSIVREISEKYAGNDAGKSILLKIKLPKGTHCVDVSKISSSPNKEEEILLNPTGKFSINGVYYNETSGMLEVEAIYEQ